MHVFRSKLDGRHHLAFAMGRLGPEPTLVRVHGENLLSDIFRAKGMDSHHSLFASLEAVARAQHGVILYIERPDGGCEVLDRLEPKDGPAKGPPCAPPPPDFRDYGTGAQILAALGLCKIRLLSSTARRVVGLDGYGLEIVEQVPL